MRLESSFIQIPGIGEKTERRLWAAGITDWRGGVETDAIGPARCDRIENFAAEASYRLERNDVSYFETALPSAARWRLAESFRSEIAALDIETTGLDPDRNHVTTVSLARDDGVRTFVRGQDLTAASLREAISDVAVLVTFNGARFDLPFLETDLGITLDRPHLDLLYPCRRIGWEGGLKAVERAVGVDRSLPDVDGRDAVRLWYRYRQGDEDALDRLVRYNQEDVRTLLPIVDEVVAALDERVYYPHVPDQEIHAADSIRS